MEVQVRRFDPSAVRADAVSVVIGKRNTGKTTLAEHLLSLGSAGGLLVSPYAGCRSEYAGAFPPERVHEDLEPGMLAGVIARQKAAPARSPRTVVLDDCVQTRELDDEFRGFLRTGPSWGAGLIWTMSYAFPVPPSVRGCVDYAFIFREPVESARRRLYDTYCGGGGLLPFEAFCGLLDRTTEDHGCLVVHNTSASNRAEDCLFSYRAPPPRADAQMYVGVFPHARIEA